MDGVDEAAQLERTAFAGVLAFCVSQPSPTCRIKCPTQPQPVSLKVKSLSQLLNLILPIPQPFLFLSAGMTTWLAQTFTVASEHIRLYFLVFLFLHFLVVGAVR